ncbi:MAG: hypothetical protein PHW69_03965 [Elusimicrobiaceae bacterium]|nr:hypothetical protein [Elusimicrobiaceae bacterium]
MKKFFRCLHWSLLIFFAVAGGMSVVTALFPGLAIRPLILAVWLLTAWYFLGVVLFKSALRDRFLGYVAAVRERDECEEYIVGRAAKAVFLVTLGGFLAVGIWAMGTVNVLFIQNTDNPQDGIKKSIPFIGLALPVQWPQHSQLAWVSRNPGEPVQYRRVENVRDVMIYKKGYQILLTPPLHPRLSRIMFLCALLQIALFHLFAKLTKRNMRHTA